MYAPIVLLLWTFNAVNIEVSKRPALNNESLFCAAEILPKASVEEDIFVRYFGLAHPIGFVFNSQIPLRIDLLAPEPEDPSWTVTPALNLSAEFAKETISWYLSQILVDAVPFWSDPTAAPEANFLTVPGIIFPTGGLPADWLVPSSWLTEPWVQSNVGPESKFSSSSTYKHWGAAPLLNFPSPR